MTLSIFNKLLAMVVPLISFNEAQSSQWTAGNVLIPPELTLGKGLRLIDREMTRSSDAETAGILRQYAPRPN